MFLSSKMQERECCEIFAGCGLKLRAFKKLVANPSLLQALSDLDDLGCSVRNKTNIEPDDK